MKPLPYTLLLLLTTPTFAITDAQFYALQQRVEQLEARLNNNSGNTPAPTRTQRIKTQTDAARERMKKDGQTYDLEALHEIEQLYKTTHDQWETKDARHTLAKLIAKYDLANRTGCALLRMGKMRQGKEKEKYLKMAIDYHSDCYYPDGTSVGALARYLLAQHLHAQNNSHKAQLLEQQLLTNYPNAIDHQNVFLADLLQ